MIGIARANEDQEEQSHVTGQGSSRRRSTGDLEAPPLEAASSAPVSSLGSHLSQRGGLISDPEAFGRTLRILSDGKKDTAALEVALWDLVYLSATGIQV